MNPHAVIAHIRAAFANVTLGNGTGLREANGIDDREDETIRAALRATDEKEDWSRIPPERLNESCSALGFQDAEGMRFHLPAHLIASLLGEYHFDVDIYLVELTGERAKPFSLFTPAQRNAVRAYLLYLAQDPEQSWGHEQWLRAANDDWPETGNRVVS